tara:strand:+ start:1061 stop:1612 length:552 start_codon:yes stop_codon:yes gene_type:complete
MIDEYVRIYDDVVPPDFCDDLVNKFEASSEQWQRESSSSYDFTQIDMGKNMKSWSAEMGELLNLLFPCVANYKEDISPMWPDKHGFESPRIKRYMPDGVDEFRTHVDVNDYANAKRFLVFFLYLTDNEAGQTVVWPNAEDFKVVSPCKKGSVLAFPPLWTHPHAGMPPIKTPKYIVGSYLHYI